MKKKVLSLLLAASVCTVTAFASVGVKNSNAKRGSATVPTTSVMTATDLNFVGVSQLYSDGSTATVDLTNTAATGGTIDGVVIGGASPSTVFQLSPYVVISATANTLNTVGSYTGNNSVVSGVKSGSTFVYTGFIQGTACLSLPGTYSTTAGAFTGQTYTFAIGTASTLAVRTASATDATISYGLNPNTTTKITSPASSGSTVTLMGVGSTWYITSMSNGNSATTGGPNWTPGSF